MTGASSLACTLDHRTAPQSMPGTNTTGSMELISVAHRSWVLHGGLSSAFIAGSGHHDRFDFAEHQSEAEDAKDQYDGGGDEGGSERSAALNSESCDKWCQNRADLPDAVHDHSGPCPLCPWEL